MKALAVSALAALTLSTGCFTAAGAAIGSRQKDPDGTASVGATVGGAVVGALVDSAIVFAYIINGLDDSLSNDDGFDSRRAPMMITF